MRHVVDHRLHVLFLRSDDGWSENDRQVFRFHFVNLAVIHDLPEMEYHVFQRVVVVRR